MEKLTRSSLKGLSNRAIFARFASRFLLLGIGFLEASKKANLSFKSTSLKPHLNQTGSVFAPNYPTRIAASPWHCWAQQLLQISRSCMLPEKITYISVDVCMLFCFSANSGCSLRDDAHQMRADPRWTKAYHHTCCWSTDRLIGNEWMESQRDTDGPAHVVSLVWRSNWLDHVQESEQPGCNARVCAIGKHQLQLVHGLARTAERDSRQLKISYHVWEEPAKWGQFVGWLKAVGFSESFVRHLCKSKWANGARKATV